MFSFGFVCLIEGKRQARKERNKNKNSSDNAVFTDKYNKTSINPDSSYRRIVKLSGWWQHQIWRNMKWQPGILGQKPKEIWGIEWTVKSSLIADDKDEYILENETLDGWTPPPQWIDKETGQISRSKLTGADCFDDVDELVKRMKTKELHPAATHLLTRYKRLMYNVGLVLHLFQLLHVNCPTVNHNWQINTRIDRIVPYAAMRSGYNLMYLQLLQQNVIGECIDRAFTNVTGRSFRYGIGTANDHKRQSKYEKLLYHY